MCFGFGFGFGVGVGVRGTGFSSLTVVVKSNGLTVPMEDTCTMDGKTYCRRITGTFYCIN